MTEVEPFALETQRQQKEASEFERQFAEIVELNPDLHENVTAVLHLNAELERSDLPTDRMQYLKDERRDMVEELIADPVASVVTEFGILAKRYDGRTLVSREFDGSESRSFVTRDPERDKADLHFRAYNTKSGKSIVSIEVPSEITGNPHTDEPFFIRIDTEQGMKIEQRVYRRGRYEYEKFSPDSEEGKNYLWRFFTHTITATDLLDHRSEDELKAADAQARRMLKDKIRQR